MKTNSLSWKENKVPGIAKSIFIFIIFLAMASAVYANNLADVNGNFFDGFESGSISTKNWTNTGTGSAWAIDNDPYQGLNNIKATDTVTMSVIQTNISTAGYGSITFAFYAYTDGLDNGEYIAADWYNGTTWINALPQTEDIGSYTLYNYSLPAAAEDNPDFKIRFRCLSSNPNEDCYVDNVQVTGIDSTPPGTIGNLTNQSSGVSSIYWVWDNPSDADFNYTIIYIDGVWEANTTNAFYNKTGLIQNTNYTITVHTVDTNGNVNDTDKNNTAWTLADTTVPVINNVTDSPDPVNQGQSITITANVTDNYNVSSAWVEINGTNYTMTQAGELWQYSYNTAPLAIGLYNYTVYANDTFNLEAIPVISNFTVYEQPNELIMMWLDPDSGELDDSNQVIGMNEEDNVMDFIFNFFGNIFTMFTD
jgi:hypothetical protein